MFVYFFHFRVCKWTVRNYDKFLHNFTDSLIQIQLKSQVANADGGRGTENV